VRGYEQVETPPHPHRWRDATSPRKRGEVEAVRPRTFPANVPKSDGTLTFSATIRRDVNHMQTITVITLLALLTISGAVISDRILTGEGQPVVSLRF
jgi:hypothetical protein